jgi:hypothetical protein
MKVERKKERKKEGNKKNNVDVRKKRRATLRVGEENMRNGSKTTETNKIPQSKVAEFNSEKKNKKKKERNRVRDPLRENQFCQMNNNTC